MEALERRGKIVAMVVVVFIVFWSQCRGVGAHKNSTKMSYVCPPQFLRLGHSCYFFSENKAIWKDALFSCKDKDSNLSVPARWEDRNLRKYLNEPIIKNATRWIGGTYDYNMKAWKWGGELRLMQYQSFSKMKKLTPEELQWHCIAMIPDLLYRWAPRSCLESHQYICQTKLLKVPKSKVKDLRRRWQRMGKTNEITAPTLSRENNAVKVHDVGTNSFLKTYDLGPGFLRQKPQQDDPGVVDSAQTTQKPVINKPVLRKRPRRPHNIPRRLKKPFPGYHWNRHDPEGSFKYNAEILKSGRSGLKPNQVKAQLARLRHLRDRQVQRRDGGSRASGDWLVNEPRQMLADAETHIYTVDNNISALHPKTIVEEFDLPYDRPVVLPRPERAARHRT